MKKSNLLLLNGFIAIIVLVTAIHLKLYATYKKGDYTVHKREDFFKSYPKQQFSHVKFVVLQNIPSASVRFADTAQVEKSENSGIQYIQTGDTLVVSGRNTAEMEGGQFFQIIIDLPLNVSLSAINSTLSFSGREKVVGNDPVIHLQNSRLIFSGQNQALQFGHMKIVASDSSMVAFQHNTEVDTLEVQLSNSTIAYGEGKIGQLSIITDSMSTISLPYKHLLKAKITTHENP
jgi:hypothetical protein